jgi:hypothetical protein
LHHDFRERNKGTRVGVHGDYMGDKGGVKRIFWFKKKDFGESEKWITFAELSPENWGLEMKLNRITNEYKKFIEDIEKERRRTTKG